MSMTPEMPRQRAGREAAAAARSAAVDALQPLHDTLLDESPRSFDGLVTFAIDQWHERNASAVATLQPDSDDTERFAFYHANIENNRIDLDATAFGDARHLRHPAQLQSRMNPDQLTYTQRVIINGRDTGGVQSAHNTKYGEPLSEKKLEAIWKKYTPEIEAVMHEFYRLASLDGIRSLGDTLELDAPTTPNAFIISWDLVGSTALAKKNYGMLRNLLLDTKGEFYRLTSDLKGDYHDNGDGQDMIFWLPDGVDRADPQSIGLFGQSMVIPLLHRIMKAHKNLITTDYPDETPRPQIRFAVGLGNVEKNHFEGRTSQHLWELDSIMNTDARSAVGYTMAARAVLDIVAPKK
jgi:hypothetical protein